MPYVLVVEDDLSIAQPLVRALRREALDVDHVLSGEQALRRLAESRVDLVLLDLGLPGMDGVSVCRAVRAKGDQTSVLMLTARTADLDQVLGLDAGADDYLTKPFSLAVLLARVRVLLRRAPVRPGEPVQAAGVRVDPAARRAWRGDRELPLSPKEFDLLLLLVQRAGEAVPREEIMARVWDPNWWGSTKTLDVHMGWLRAKLAEPALISTVRGHGFRLEHG